MSHDPALFISELRPEPENFRSIVASGIEGHEKCDVLIARVSGGLTEVGCPGVDRDHTHATIQWMDADILRFLSYYNENDPRVSVQKLRTRPIFRCWTHKRINRLRAELEITD